MTTQPLPEAPAAEQSRSDPASAAGAAHHHALIEKLVGEREPSLQQLLEEREQSPRFYSALIQMFEAKLRVLVRERDGTA